MTQWTAPSLLREFSKRFADDAYAAEELFASSVQRSCSSVLGVSAEPRADHARYLARWIKILKCDRKAFITAARKAAWASVYLPASTHPEMLKAAEGRVQRPERPPLQRGMPSTAVVTNSCRAGVSMGVR